MKFFIYIKKGYPSTPPPVKSKSLKRVAHDDESDLLNLTGSPLKDSCLFDSLGDSLVDGISPKKNAWNGEEEIYQCIQLSDAQYGFCLYIKTTSQMNFILQFVISIFRFNINRMLMEFKKQSTPKFWSVCESSDNKTLLLSNQLNGGNNRRGILTFNVCVFWISIFVSFPFEFSIQC